MKKMKNLKMFAIAIMAFAVMAMGVHATGTGVVNSYPNANESCVSTSNCVAEVNGHHYTDFALALTDASANGDTIKLLVSVGATNLGSTINTVTSTSLTKSVTIDLNGFDLDLRGAKLSVGKDSTGAAGTLTIKGAGNVTSVGLSTGAMISVAEGAKFVTEGEVKLTGIASTSVIDTKGTVVIGKGTEFAGSGNSFVLVSGNKADVTIDAVVGTKNAPSSVKLVNVTAAAPGRTTDTVAKVTIAGGEYYLSTSILTVSNRFNAKVDGGLFTVTGKAFEVNGGSLELNSGVTVTSTIETVVVNSGDVTIDGASLKSTTMASVLADNVTPGEGSLTIKTGKIVSDATSPLWLRNAKLTYKIEGATFEGPDDTPAIYIADAQLTGIKEGGKADNYKSIVTGGKFLYMIVGEAKRSDGAPDDYSAEDVAKYIVAEGKEVTEEGNYKLVGAGAGDKTDEPGEQPGTTEPGTTGDGNQGPTDNVENPNTNDNILVYAGLGLVSLASVAFTTRKRED